MWRQSECKSQTTIQGLKQLYDIQSDLFSTFLWQTDGWNERGACYNGEHFDQICKSQRQLGVCWKSRDGQEKPVWEGQWALPLQCHFSLWVCHKAKILCIKWCWRKTKRGNWLQTNIFSLALLSPVSELLMMRKPTLMKAGRSWWRWEAVFQGPFLTKINF